MTEPKPRTLSDGKRGVRRDGLAVKRQLEMRSGYRYGARIIEFDFRTD